MGRPTGTVGSCGSCGQLGHNGSRSGCSPTYLAAQRVIAGQCTITEAAMRFGVTKQSVSERLIKQGHRVRGPR